MKVKDLIELLEDCDADAEVLIMSQENWPFENTVAGVVARQDCHGEGDEDGDEDDATVERRHKDGTAPNDVFLVEGQQLRYGSKAAWGAARRR
jgi:hypothetical protein